MFFGRRGAFGSTRRYSGCTISKPLGPRRASPKQRMRAPRARPVLLLRGEIKESQRQEAGAVGDLAQHLPAAAKDDFGEQHFALHRRALPGTQLAQGHDARAIFVAQRQQKQQILGGLDPQGAQPRGERIADAAQYRDRLESRSQSDDALHFDLRSARQRGHADGGPRRIRFAEVFGHDLVDQSRSATDRSGRSSP